MVAARQQLGGYAAGRHARAAAEGAEGRPLDPAIGVPPQVDRDARLALGIIDPSHGVRIGQAPNVAWPLEVVDGDRAVAGRGPGIQPRVAAYDVVPEVEPPV